MISVVFFCLNYVENDILLTIKNYKTKLEMKKLILAVALIVTAQFTYAQDKKADIALARSSFGKANNFKMNYELDSAAHYFGKAAKLFKKHNKKGNYIQSEYSRGDIMVFKSKYKDAGKIFNKLEKYAISNYSDSSKYLTNVYYGLGTVDFYQGKMTSAITNYQKSQNILIKTGKEHSMFGAGLYAALGNAYSQLGKYSLSQVYYRRDIDIRYAVAGSNDPSLSVAYINMSIAQQNTGNYAEALVNAEKSLVINLKFKGENNPETAQSYARIGSVYTETGQDNLAEQYITRALNIEKKLYGNQHQKIASKYILLGVISKNRENYDEALSYFKKARSIQKKVLGSKHPDAAMTCNNMGMIFEKKGKYGSALSYYKKAIKIKSQFVPSDHPDLAVYYNNIGLALISQKKYSEALGNLKKSAEITERNFGKKTPLLVKAYANIAFIYKHEAKYDTALHYYQSSLAANIHDFYPENDDITSNPTLEKYYDIGRVLISLQGKAEALEKLGEIKNDNEYLVHSIDTYKAADRAVTIARKEAITEEDKIRIAKQTKLLYEFAIVLAIKSSETTNDKFIKRKMLEDAFYFSERSKAGVLQEAIDAANAKKFAGIPDSILVVEKLLKTKIASVEKLIAETTDDDELKELRDVLFTHNLKVLVFEDKIKKKYPDYYENSNPKQQAGAERIMEKLPAGTAIQSYFVGDSLLITFSLTHTEINASFKKLPKNFNQQMIDFRRDLTAGTKLGTESYNRAAWRLHKMLFPKELSEYTDKLIIIPDGIIGTIPFEALFTEKFEGEYNAYSSYPFLIKKYQVSYYYSSDLFFRSHKLSLAQNAPKSWLGLAPVFDKELSRKYEGSPIVPLPGTESEVDTIAIMFNKQNLVQAKKVRFDATEDFMKSDSIGKYKYVHIATHGTVNTEHPELSGILLGTSTDPNSKEDAMLYSGEIYNLELQAELVVLSACETGLGKISKGEGVIGLSRALLYAGADNLIVSLWKVSDNSTAEMMTHFYSDLLESEKHTFTSPLHKAKLKLIESEKYAHPYYWSPFILIGK